jgi:hypothetical protein
MSTARDLLLPLSQAARLLYVPATWLRTEADAGRLPCLRAGSQYLFDVDLIGGMLLERARGRGALVTAEADERECRE